MASLGVEKVVSKISKLLTSELRRYLCRFVRGAITTFFVAVVYWKLKVHASNFASAMFYAAATVLPCTAIHLGEALNKTITTVVGIFLGGSLGYSLHVLHENGKADFAFLLTLVLLLIAFGLYGKEVMVKDTYKNAIAAFVLSSVAALSLTDWWADEFSKKAAALGIAYSLTTISFFLPPFWAGDDVHNRVQDYPNTLADLFEALGGECFVENCKNKKFEEKPLIETCQSLIDSKEKENSLSKHASWEPRRHPQEQYEKIGDVSRSCACSIRSFSTNLTKMYCTENFQFNEDVRDTCRKMCSASAEALKELARCMKDKTAPASTAFYYLLTNAVNLAKQLENMTEVKCTPFLVQSVMDIKKLGSAVEELAGRVPFKQIDQAIIVPELIAESKHAATQQEANISSNPLVALKEKLASRHSAWKKKFQRKCVPLSNGISVASVNLISVHNPKTQNEEDRLGHVSIAIDPVGVH